MLEDSIKSHGEHFYGATHYNIYCLIDEYLKAVGAKDDIRAAVSNAEVLLIGHMAVSDFAGNYHKARLYFYFIEVLCEAFEFTKKLKSTPLHHTRQGKTPFLALYM